MHATLCQPTATPTVTVVKPHGHLNAVNSDDFKDRLLSAVSAPQTSILLIDLEQVESLDSSGLMALIVGLKRSRDSGCRFSLCSVSPAIQIVFELTQLDRVFEIFDDRAAFQAEVG